MIPALLAAVLLAFVIPLPALAIPGPDLITPLLTALTAIFGVLLTFSGAAVVMLRRAHKRLFATPVHVMVGISLLALLIVGIGVGSIWWLTSEYTKYKKALIAEEEPEPPFPAPVEPPPPPLPPTDTFNGITSRVASSTLLVPIEILQELVSSDPNWATSSVYVLDIREPEEQEVGYIPVPARDMSIADLVAGGYAELPRNKDILVICWTSLRGEQMTTFLRQRGFDRAFAINHGLQGESLEADNGWIGAGLPWSGTNKFSAMYGTYQPLGPTKARSLIAQTPIILDSRSATSRKALPLPKSRWAYFRENLTTGELETIKPLIPKNAELTIVCDGYVSCYYARILGIRLSRQGWTYDAPIDFRATSWDTLQ